jgi:cobalt-zinc-cadmium efflux system outer membrane protein
MIPTRGRGETRVAAALLGGWRLRTVGKPRDGCGSRTLSRVANRVAGPFERLANVGEHRAETCAHPPMITPVFERLTGFIAPRRTTKRRVWPGQPATPLPWVRRRVRLWLGLAGPVLSLAGCATYQPHPLTEQAVDRALTVPAPSVIAARAATLEHPILPSVRMDPTKPLTPEEAAVVAVLLNPALRAQRDRVGVSSAQLIQAGLLPNPQLTLNAGVVVAGPGTFNPFGIGGNWDITGLITRNAKKRAAALSLESVRLDVAWSEWQAAEAAKSAAYAVVALERELVEAEAEQRQLDRNFQVVQGAYDRHQQTVLDLSAAQASRASAYSTVLDLRQQLAAQRAKLRDAIGLPQDTPIRLRSDTPLPCRLQLPAEPLLVEGLRARRLDLLGLRKGYQSQEEKVRTAILARFPKINLGVSQATDNSGITEIGFAANITLPIFDHNQGAIALQRATRQRLFDEYTNRVFQARSDIGKLYSDATALQVRVEAERTAVLALEKLVVTLRRAMLLGQESLINYYAQVQNLDAARINLIKFEGQLVNDWVSLELASGERLGPPPSCGIPLARGGEP